MLSVSVNQHLVIWDGALRRVTGDVERDETPRVDKSQSVPRTAPPTVETIEIVFELVFK